MRESGGLGRWLGDWKDAALCNVGKGDGDRRAETIKLAGGFFGGSFPRKHMLCLDEAFHMKRESQHGMT